MIRETSAGGASGLDWFKSSYSSSSEGDSCVEVARTVGTILVRDSKSVPGPHLGFERTAWTNFVAHAAGS
ncbi:DUF397 domain-containing protein [Streptomyces sp. NPDC005752]|uniref:DUF397 domain-containing protein n=1 Tax=Streptomyces sp. NPDC005752 TaxID=3157065 RepID=UPI0033CD0EDE